MAKFFRTKGGFILLFGLLISIVLLAHSLNDNFKRWAVTICLILYPLYILIYHRLIKQDSIRTDRLNYKKYFFSLGTGFIYMHLTVFLSFTIALSFMDLGVCLVFFVSCSLSWLFVTLFAGVRDSFRIKKFRPGNNIILSLIFFIAVLFVIVQFSGNERTINSEFTYSKRFHARFLSILGKTEEVIVKSSALNKEKTPGITEMERAEQNKWFINNYFGEQPGILSTLKPHFSVGSNYATQLSDTLPARYLISEHGLFASVLPLFLLLILLTFPLRSIGEAENEYTGRSIGNLFSVYFLSMLICFAAIDVLVNINAFPFTGISYLIFGVNDVSFTLVFLTILMIISFLYRWQDVSGLQRLRIRQFLFATIPIALLGVISLSFILFRKNAQNYQLSFLKKNLQDCSNEINDNTHVYLDHLGGKQKNQWVHLKSTEFYRHLLREPSILSLLASLHTKAPAASEMIEKFLGTNVEKNNPSDLLFVERDHESGGWKIKVNDRFYFKTALNNKNTYPVQNLAAFDKTNTLSPAGFYFDKNSVPGDRILYSTQLINGASVLALPTSAFRRLADKVDDKNFIYLAEPTANSIVLSNIPGVPDNEFAQRINSKEGFSITTKDQKTDPVIFRPYSTSDELIARAFWINGKYQYLYPPNPHLLYNFMLSQNLMSQHLQKPSRLTLDINLEKAFDTLLLRAYKDSPVKASITVLDGDGNLRAMVQNESYKEPGSEAIEVDPNYFSSLSEFFILIHKLSEVNAHRLLQRRSLISDGKPGSTIKPFTWASAIDGFGGKWDQLSLVSSFSIPADQEGHSNNLSLKYFAGQKVNSFFYDEKGDLAAADFLSHSKNSYHILINFLGSFDKENLKKTPLWPGFRPDLKKEGVFVAGGDSTNIIDYPMTRIGNDLFHFSSDLSQWPQYSATDGEFLFGNQNSILAEGLGKNFKLLTNSDSAHSKNSVPDWYRNNSTDTILLKNDLFIDLILPQFALYQENLRKVSRINLDGGSYYTFRASQVGAEVYKVSPSFLCQMAIRLVKLNNNIKCRIIQDKPAALDSVNWQYDQDGYNITQSLFNMHRKTIWESMHRSNAIQGGTAYDIFNYDDPENSLDMRDGELRIGGHILYLYTKTGTADESDNKSILRRKNLLIIITDQKLHSALLDKHHMPKCIAVYFQLRNHTKANWAEYDKHMIKQSILSLTQSASFKSYFNTP
jgi:hypothetical protein